MINQKNWIKPGDLLYDKINNKNFIVLKTYHYDDRVCAVDFNQLFKKILVSNEKLELINHGEYNEK
jgi:hypothetical protein